MVVDDAPFGAASPRADNAATDKLFRLAAAKEAELTTLQEELAALRSNLAQSQAARCLLANALRELLFLSAETLRLQSACGMPAHVKRLHSGITDARVALLGELA